MDVCRRGFTHLIIMSTAAVAAVSVLGACQNGTRPVSEGSAQPVDSQDASQNSDATADSGQEPAEYVEPENTEVVPGLDSADGFCSAWSRFGGSWLVVSSAWPIAEDPELGEEVKPAFVEVVAAPTIVAAFDDMKQDWPAELGDVRDQGVASLQPQYDRVGRSYQRLVAAGADDQAVAALDEWWVDWLDGWDGSSFPAVDDIPGDVRDAVVAAAEQTGADEQPTFLDPALQAEPVQPVLDYLAQNCPDRGGLSGESVIEDGA